MLSSRTSHVLHDSILLLWIPARAIVRCQSVPKQLPMTKIHDLSCVDCRPFSAVQTTENELERRCHKQ